MFTYLLTFLHNGIDWNVYFTGFHSMLIKWIHLCDEHQSQCNFCNTLAHRLYWITACLKSHLKLIDLLLFWNYVFLLICFFSFGSILAEEFLSSKEKYQQEAKEHTAKTAAKSFNDKEQVKFPNSIKDSLNLRKY